MKFLWLMYFFLSFFLSIYPSIFFCLSFIQNQFVLPFLYHSNKLSYSHWRQYFSCKLSFICSNYGRINLKIFFLFFFYLARVYMWLYVTLWFQSILIVIKNYRRSFTHFLDAENDVGWMEKKVFKKKNLFDWYKIDIKFNWRSFLYSNHDRVEKADEHEKNIK